MGIRPDIELEVGKAYLDTNGERVYLRGPTLDDTDAFVGDNGKTYTKEGRIVAGKLDPKDLVEEASE